MDAKTTPWYVRLLEKMGLNLKSPQAHSVIAGTSKRGRAKIKSRDWERRRKIRRKMTQASQRRNR